MFADDRPCQLNGRGHTSASGERNTGHPHSLKVFGAEINKEAGLIGLLASARHPHSVNLARCSSNKGFLSDFSTSRLLSLLCRNRFRWSFDGQVRAGLP